MAAKATTDYVLSNGLVVGVEFKFANGSVHRIMLAELNDAVRNHAAANGIREATRDTFADATTADEAEASFLKRKEAMVGEAGQYASRGGQRLDWVGDIMEAARRLDPNATEATMAKRREALASMQPDTLKAWLADKSRRPLAKMVDAIRKERAAERAKAGVTGASLNW